MIGKVRRVLNLRRLIAIEDRIESLERSDPSQSRRIDDLQRRIGVLGSRLEHFEEQLDLLKSSVQVPRELVEDFTAWKARTPVPREPLVTVAVATYNRARLLMERCLPSILAQTYDRLEVVVVGDGCTDATEAEISRIGDPRVRFVNLPERGTYPTDPVRRWMVAGTPALNTAMSLANGDFVTHLDDDDEYLPERLEKLVTFALEQRCDLVWHPCWSEDEHGEWHLVEASRFAYAQVTTSSVFYRSWFTKIEWDIDAHLLREPGDWNRFRRILYVGPVLMRYPEPLLRHHRQMNQVA